MMGKMERWRCSEKFGVDSLARPHDSYVNGDFGDG